MNYLIDSNILIYACRAEYPFLVDFITDNLPVISIISKIEVLGYHRLSPGESRQLELLFDLLNVKDLSEEIAAKAIELKQRRKMTLGDSIIAVTAIITKSVLVTRNTDDFRDIGELSILDPFNK